MFGNGELWLNGVCDDDACDSFPSMCTIVAIQSTTNRPIPGARLMLQIIFYVAVVAEAMTAALAAGRRKMDWFGVCVLACVTALGGGTMRDTFCSGIIR